MVSLSSSSSSSLRRCLQSLTLSAHASTSSSVRLSAARFTTSLRRLAEDDPATPDASSPPSSSSPTPSKEDGPEKKSTPAADAPPARPARGARNRNQTEALAADGPRKSGHPEVANDTPPRRRSPQRKARSSTPDIPIDFTDLSTFPSILDTPDPVLDSGEYIEVQPCREAPYGGSITIYNSEKHFKPSPMSAVDIAQSTLSGAVYEEAEQAETALGEVTPLSAAEIRQFHRHVLALRRVIHMTAKGKIASMSATMVVGNGKGMVGFGNGKAENAGAAVQKAYKEAVKKMDFIDRFEHRTIHRSIVGRWGGTKVYMRPRPSGFGLRVPPSVHAIARSSGIKDLSASIIGSTNPINVCRAVLAALLPGAGPVAMGNGIGGKSRKEDRGQGIKTLEDLEIERGRRYRSIRS